MSTGQKSQTGSTKVREVTQSRQGQFDLSQPPSREEAGMPAGASTVTYQRDDHQPFQLQIQLPDGKKLAVSARLLTFDSMSSADSTTAAPSTMDVHVYPSGLAAGRDALLADAKTFGLNATLITKWYDEARAPRPPQAPPTVSSPWLHSKVGYLDVGVQAQYSPTVSGASGSDQTVLHYMLTWTAASA